MTEERIADLEDSPTDAKPVKGKKSQQQSIKSTKHVQFNSEAAANKNMSVKVVGGVTVNADQEDSEGNASTFHTTRPSVAERKYSSHGIEIIGEVNDETETFDVSQTLSQ